MTSIQKNLSYNDLASFVASVVRTHINDEIMTIVVEGQFDMSLYTRLCNQSCFDIVFCKNYAGCGHFGDLFTKLNGKYPNRFLVIKDADFDRLNGVIQSYDNLFITDRHDIEMMMLTDNFNKIISQTYNIANAKEQIDITMHEIIHLSYIKWMNNVCGTKYRFDAINIGHSYDGTKCVDIDDWIVYIKKDKVNMKLACIGALTKIAVQNFEKAHPLLEEDILQLTNGHDLVKALERKIHSFSRQNVSIKKVNNLLSSSYTKDDFKKTGLCNDIAKWLDSIGFDYDVV